MAAEGVYPLNSLWVGYQSLYKKHIWADADQSLKTIIGVWFFVQAQHVFPMPASVRTVK
jgi:hypothetical protein